MEAGWDGGVLEISINGGARQDIIAAGGSFLAGGYNHDLSGDLGPAAWSTAWSGNSGGYIDTIVNLPPAAIGQTVQFHWVDGTDTYDGELAGVSTRSSCAASPVIWPSTLETHRIRPIPLCPPAMAQGMWWVEACIWRIDRCRCGRTAEYEWYGRRCQRR